MLRRSIVHALLSLLLLLSQQMGIAHGMSHWTGSGPNRAQLSEQGAATPGLALDQVCDQCLAFAQIGSALGSTDFSFFTPEHTQSHLPDVSAQSICRRTVCAFRSRAPPVTA